MIHGETKIELYNPNTKIKNVVKSENTFQGTVLADCLSQLSSGQSIYGFSRTTPWWTDLVGGLLLFRDSIQVGSKYMPSSNQMIGNACYGLSNANEPNELGSYNSQESSYTDGVITQVYDFTTNQANGQIGCVCLTSQTGGFTGYGNPSGARVTANNSRFLLSQGGKILNNNNARLPKYESADVSGRTQQIILGKYYYRISAWNNTTKVMSFFKSRTPIRVASVFDEIHSTVDIDFSQVDVPSNLSNYTSFSLISDGNKAYVIPASFQNVTAGSNFVFWEVDFTNNTVTKKTVTNTTGAAIQPATMNIANDCLFVYKNVTNDWKTYIFDIATSVHKSTLVHTRHINRTYRRFTGDKPVMLEYWDHTYIYNICFIDIDNGYVIPTNGGVDTQSDHCFTYDEGSDCLILDNRYGILLYNNPLYLATINNLNSPVTKTAAQTMKVTYSLTEA